MADAENTGFMDKSVTDRSFELHTFTLSTHFSHHTTCDKTGTLAILILQDALFLTSTVRQRESRERAKRTA